MKRGDLVILTNSNTKFEGSYGYSFDHDLAIWILDLFQHRQDVYCLLLCHGSSNHRSIAALALMPARTAASSTRYHTLSRSPTGRGPWP